VDIIDGISLQGNVKNRYSIVIKDQHCQTRLKRYGAMQLKGIDRVIGGFDGPGGKIPNRIVDGVRAIIIFIVSILVARVTLRARGS
jgi:hypothetical protein